MMTPAPELPPGTVIDGNTIGAKVRTRSGAATYAAKNSSGSDVHFTAYAAACFPTALIRERSLRELRQLQGVDAVQVARVLDCGKLEDGGIYEVGEPVIGDVLVEAGQLSRPEVGATLKAIGEALLAAQKVGVIHRNLGGNVVFATDRGLKVAGFAVGEPQPGGAFGSIDTIAPEQVTGKVVDQRTLIYNLAALAHQLLVGQPLFAGTIEQKLDLHANREAAGVDALLKRALSKDPRMRPMMLKQFVTDLGKLEAEATSAPATAPKPSTRGWTMFMEAQEAQANPMPAAAPTTPAVSAPAPSMPAPAPSAPAPAPVAPVPAAPAPAPSTRGWTMFMEAEDAGPAPGSEPAAPAPAPSPQPIAEPQPAPAAAPSTRGWTMFMDAQEPAASSAGQPAAAPQPAPQPVVTPSPAAPAPVPPPAAAPSTRGWTMFMEAEEPTASAPPAAAPTAPSPPSPVASAPVAPAPVAPGPVAPAPAAPAPAAAKPSTRGWTMFMEAEAPSEPAAAPTPEPAPTPVGTSSAPSTRGWTMFMEAQVPGEASAAEPAASAPVDEPVMAQDGASDSKGWTVFMEKQPIPPPGQGVAAAPVSPQPQPQPPVAEANEVQSSAPALVSVPATPAIEAGPPPSQPVYTPPPSQPVYPPPSSVAVPEPKSKMGIYVGVGVAIVIVVILVAIALN